MFLNISWKLNIIRKKYDSIMMYDLLIIVINYN